MSGDAHPRVLEAVDRLRGALTETGHPVLDVLVGAPRTGREGPSVRVEFAHDGLEVGVLRARAASPVLGVVTASGARRVETTGGLVRHLDLFAAGSLDGEHVRTLASNDDVRTLTAADASARARALVLVDAEFSGRSVSRTAYDRLAAVLGLLHLEEDSPDSPVADHRAAARTLALVADLEAGVPEAWAFRRFDEPGEGS